MLDNDACLYLRDDIWNVTWWDVRDRVLLLPLPLDQKPFTYEDFQRLTDTQTHTRILRRLFMRGGGTNMEHETNNYYV